MMSSTMTSMLKPIKENNTDKVLVSVTTIAVGGGAEKVAAMVANGLEKSSVATMLLTQYADPNEHQVAVPRVNLSIALKEYQQMPRWRRRLTKLVRAAARTFGTARVCRENHITTVISFLEESNFYVIFAKLLFGLRLKVIVSVRMDPRRYGSFYKFLIRTLYRHADTVVAVTRGVEETLRTEFRLDNVVTIYNPIDQALVQRMAAEPLPDEWAFLADKHGYYLNIARLTYQKGQWHLLRAFARLLENQPDATLVILGDGDYRTGLPQLAARLGIAESVYFVGQHDNVYPFLRHARCFALTSLWEGLPNAVLEALAAQVPVVAVDSTSGMRELIAPELALSDTVTYPYQASRGVLVTPFPDEDLATLFEPKDGPYSELADAMGAAHRANSTGSLTDDFAPESVIAQWRALV